ncbi:MAG: hypothetical protein M3R27_01050 [Bacteroidota bacterium]|nr:hypothetical protein [Bacteroidota bacterium]
MKTVLLICFVLLAEISMACQCLPLPVISKEIAKEYDVIFSGSIDSVTACNKGIATAHFSIRELYKGVVMQEVKVNFDCVSSCMMSFAKGEEWIMYCVYERFDRLNVKFCSHSRKNYNHSDAAIQAGTDQKPFDEEMTFLKSEFGIQPFKENEDINTQQTEMRPHNEQPSGMSKLWLLLISFGAMLIVYFVAKKIKK